MNSSLPRGSARTRPTRQTATRPVALLALLSLTVGALGCSGGSSGSSGSSSSSVSPDGSTITSDSADESGTPTNTTAVATDDTAAGTPAADDGRVPGAPDSLINSGIQVVDHEADLTVVEGPVVLTAVQADRYLADVAPGAGVWGSTSIR